MLGKIEVKFDNEKPYRYECPDCKEKFYFKSTLAFHIDKKHKEKLFQRQD
jgi:hypothetical protein